MAAASSAPAPSTMRRFNGPSARVGAADAPEPGEVAAGSGVWAGTDGALVLGCGAAGAVAEGERSWLGCSADGLPDGPGELGAGACPLPDVCPLSGV